VIDTAYSGMLLLPLEIVNALGLTWHSEGMGTMADGSIQKYDRYEAEIDWDGEPRRVIVSAVGDSPLLGTALLAGHELRAAFTPGGLVELRPLG
jgi:clan AA aspartic protease